MDAYGQKHIPIADDHSNSNDDNDSTTNESLEDEWTVVQREEGHNNNERQNANSNTDGTEFINCSLNASDNETHSSNSSDIELLEMDHKFEPKRRILSETVTSDTPTNRRVSLKGGISNLSFHYSNAKSYESLDANEPSARLQIAKQHETKQTDGVSPVHSCLDELSDAVPDLNPSRIRTYVHRRNEKLDVMLSSLLPFIYTAAISLAIGSYIGSYHAPNSDPNLLTNRELRLMSLLQDKIIVCLRDQIIQDNGIYRAVCTLYLDELTEDFEQTFRLSPELRQKLHLLQRFDTLTRSGKAKLNSELQNVCVNQPNTWQCDLYHQSKHNLNQIISLYNRWHVLLSQLRFIHVYKMFRSTPILSLGTENGTNHFHDIYNEYLKSALSQSDMATLVNGLLLENKLLWLSDPESPSVRNNDGDSTCEICEDLSIKSETYFIENKLLWQMLHDISNRLGIELDKESATVGHHRAHLAQIKARISKLHRTLARYINMLQSNIDFKTNLSPPGAAEVVSVRYKHDESFGEHISSSKQRHVSDSVAEDSEEYADGDSHDTFDLPFEKLKQLFSASNYAIASEDVNHLMSTIADYGKKSMKYSKEKVDELSVVIKDKVFVVSEHVKMTTAKAKKKIQSGDIQNYLSSKVDRLKSLGKHYFSLGQESAPKIAQSLSENFKSAISSVKEFVSNLREPAKEEKTDRISNYFYWFVV